MKTLGIALLTVTSMAMVVNAKIDPARIAAMKARGATDDDIAQMVKADAEKEQAATAAAAMAVDAAKLDEELSTKMETVCGYKFGSDLLEGKEVKLVKPFRRFTTVRLESKDGKLQGMKFVFYSPSTMKTSELAAEAEALTKILNKKYGIPFTKGTHDGHWYYVGNGGVLVSTDIDHHGLTEWLQLTIHNIAAWKKAAKAKTLTADEGADAL